MGMTANERALRELYARWLDHATRAGFALCLCAFIVYAGGLLPAYLPPSELTRYWSLPVDRFVAATGMPQGWDWVRFLGYGDVLNLGAVAILALVTPACYARLLPRLVAERDWLQVALVAAQIVVLIVAASGRLAAPG
jgi:hypothetical protein